MASSTKPLRGSFSSVYPTSFWGLRYFFFILSFWLIFFAGNWSFSFSLFQKYAILLTVIIMKKRGWILYPYSIFHAKIVDGFVLHRFINNPALRYHNLIFWHGQRINRKVLVFFSARLWIKRLLKISSMATIAITKWLGFTCH